MTLTITTLSQDVINRVCRGAVAELAARAVHALDQGPLDDFIREVRETAAASRAADAFMSHDPDGPTPDEARAFHKALWRYRGWLTEHSGHGLSTSESDDFYWDDEALRRELADVDAFTSWLDVAAPEVKA